MQPPEVPERQVTAFLARMADPVSSVKAHEPGFSIVLCEYKFSDRALEEEMTLCPCSS